MIDMNLVVCPVCGAVSMGRSHSCAGLRQKERADAAEARCTKLEEALREIASMQGRDTVMMSKARNVARAALAQGDTK